METERRLKRFGNISFLEGENSFRKLLIDRTFLDPAEIAAFLPGDSIFRIDPGDLTKILACANLGIRFLGRGQFGLTFFFRHLFIETEQDMGDMGLLLLILGCFGVVVVGYGLIGDLLAKIFFEVAADKQFFFEFVQLGLNQIVIEQPFVLDHRRQRFPFQVLIEETRFACLILRRQTFKFEELIKLAGADRPAVYRGDPAILPGGILFLTAIASNQACHQAGNQNVP